MQLAVARVRHFGLIFQVCWGGGRAGPLWIHAASFGYRPEQDCLPTCCGTASAWAKERSAQDHDKKDDKDKDCDAAQYKARMLIRRARSNVTFEFYLESLLVSSGPIPPAVHRPMLIRASFGGAWSKANLIIVVAPAVIDAAYTGHDHDRMMTRTRTVMRPTKARTLIRRARSNIITSVLRANSTSCP